MACPSTLVRSLTQFEQLVDSLVNSIEPCMSALKAAGLDKGDIDEVILVGGSTRIPAVQDAVAYFGKEPSKGGTQMRWWLWAPPSRRGFDR